MRLPVHDTVAAGLIDDRLVRLDHPRHAPPMIRVEPNLIGRMHESGIATVTPGDIRRYGLAVGDDELARSPCEVAPLGFALALRGGPTPAVELAPDTVSVHAGHTISVDEPLTAPGSYRLRTWVTDVFEKSGRTGPLTVVARRAEILDGDGRCRVVIDDQQIVRWRPPASLSHLGPPRQADHRSPEDLSPSVGGDPPEVGAIVLAAALAAPDPAMVERYAQQLGGREPLFVDAPYARSLGYEDIIVPGPLQSALFERLLRTQLPNWFLRRLSLTFRVSVIAAEPVVLSAIVVEHHLRRDGDSMICDLWLESGSSERATIGTAELHR